MMSAYLDKLNKMFSSFEFIYYIFPISNKIGKKDTTDLFKNQMNYIMILNFLIKLQ